MLGNHDTFCGGALPITSMTRKGGATGGGVGDGTGVIVIGPATSGALYTKVFVAALAAHVSVVGTNEPPAPPSFMVTVVDNAPESGFSVNVAAPPAGTSEGPLKSS